TKFVRDDGTLVSPAGGGMNPAPLPQFTMPTSTPYCIPGWRYSIQNTAGVNVDFMIWFPIYVAVSQAFTAIAIEVTTAAAAGGLCRLGLYADAGTAAPTGATGAPLDTGTVATDTFGVKELAISRTLQGWYWLAFNYTASCQTRYASTLVDTPISPYTSAPNGSGLIGLARSQSASSAMPTTPVATAVMTSSTTGIISAWLKK
ncbi:MAG: hypothetical protein QOJ48_438, partial [Frankiales bacterium]|nr:hypothetical protein [Frankiales bacterium]